MVRRCSDSHLSTLKDPNTTDLIPKMAQDPARTLFFGAKHFAVAGASSDPRKFGHVVFKWYLDRNMPVTPINPNSTTITVGGKEYVTVASLSELPDPQSTSLSIVTPPSVTVEILREAKEFGIRAVWLQPGSFNAEVWGKYALPMFPKAAVGACVLQAREGEIAAAGYLKEVEGAEGAGEV